MYLYNEGRVIYLSTVRCTDNEFASNRPYCPWQGSWFWVRPASKLWKADVKEGYIDSGVSITMDCRKKSIVKLCFPLLIKANMKLLKMMTRVDIRVLGFWPATIIGSTSFKECSVAWCRFFSLASSWLRPHTKMEFPTDRVQIDRAWRFLFAWWVSFWQTKTFVKYFLSMVLDKCDLHKIWKRIIQFLSGSDNKKIVVLGLEKI